MPNTKILVVEDEKIVAMDIKHRLITLGYSVPAVVTSGEESIEKTAEIQPDLVLMDIVLKEKMNGTEAAQQIRDSFDIPVVYLTAYANEKTLGRAKLTEPFGYILKPFEDRELHSTIEVALHKHKMEMKLKESEKKFRKLFNNANDAIFLHELTGDGMPGRFIEVNDVACQRLGYSREEFLKMSLKDIDDSEKAVDVPKIMEELSKNGSTTFEMVHVSKDGFRIPVEISSHIFTFKGREVILSIARDIRDRKEAEKQREELIREKTKAELHGFAVSAVPVFASFVTPQVKNLIVQSFAERFEENMKPSFEEEMESLGYTQKIREKEIDPKKVFNGYISWISNLLSNLGIKTRMTFDKRYLEFLNCPWEEDARKNPIFCLICRTMIMRSFNWTSLNETVSQISSIADDSKTCKFEFYIPILQK